MPTDSTDANSYRDQTSIVLLTHHVFSLPLRVDYQYIPLQQPSALQRQMDLPRNHFPLSPPASAASPTPTTTSFTSKNPDLPAPRSHPLKPGSPKESALINYLDDKILRITRRYAKKFSEEMASKDDAPGYTTYEEFVADADPLLDVAWISGTRKS